MLASLAKKEVPRTASEGLGTTLLNFYLLVIALATVIAATWIFFTHPSADVQCFALLGGLYFGSELRALWMVLAA